MAKATQSIDDVKAEIEELRKSPYVKIAKKAENDALRQKLYQLRSLDKKGRKIAETLGLVIDEERR
jgi:selenocysteine-specific translation elongation factor